MQRLEAKKVAILVAHEFADIELLYLLLRLSEEGAAITVGTLPAGAIDYSTRPYIPGKPVTGRFGYTIPIMGLAVGTRYEIKSISELDFADYDAVVIPGGFAPDSQRINEETLTFVAEMYRAGKVVAAICHGAQVFISTDLVKGTDIMRGKKVCSYITVRDDLCNAGALWEDVPAVTEGNVVTGRVPDDLPEFCAHIIEAINNI